MRVISNRALADFAVLHPSAEEPLQAWRKVLESQDYAHYAALKGVMNATDKVGDYYVFDVGGNKFRIITAIHFNRQMVFIRHVLTHAEYDKWKP